MEWKTRITELLGCKYPILQGSLSKFGDWKFAAAVAKTGAHGTITAHVSKTPERLREHIRNYQELTDEPCTVNLSLGNFPYTDEYLDVCIETGIKVIETSAMPGDKYGMRAKQAGIKWIQKVATVRQALHAQKVGADAVIIVGLEGIGYKGIDQPTTMITACSAAKHIKIPWVLAGGLGDAYGLLAALATGADGIMMGTRFMATQECPMPERFKQQMLELTAGHPRIRYEVLAPPDPKEYNELMAMRDKLPTDQFMPKLEKVLLKHKDWREVTTGTELYEDVEYLGNLLSMAVEFVDSIPTCQELVDSIIKEAEEIIERGAFYQNLRAR